MKNNLTIKTLVVGQMQTNCYLIIDQETLATLIIDPGDDSEYIGSVISREGLTPTHIIATHGHFDHILGVFELQGMFHVPFILHKNDDFLLSRMKESAQFFLHRYIIEPAPQSDGFMVQGQCLFAGKHKFVVIETPGHTPGSICLYQKERHLLITGDTLFANGGVGRTDFDYSSGSNLKSSIHKLFELSEDSILYPGHGESSTLVQEQKYHRFTS